jgi:hypothetical protein
MPFMDKVVVVNCQLVGRTPWSAAGPLAGFLRRSTKADDGVGRGPGGPPHYSAADPLPIDLLITEL